MSTDNKSLYLLRGISGSGKSTLAKEIVQQEGKEGIIVSADDYFINPQTKKYEFRGDKIPAAHQWAQNKAFNAMRQGVSPILIDNTNTQCWEAKPYVEEALKQGYNVVIREPQTPWAKNAEELAKRNVHGVPLDKIREMLKRWDNDFTVESIMKSKSKFKRKNNANDDPNKRQKMNENVYAAVMQDGSSEVRNMSGYIGIFGPKIEETLSKNPDELVPKDYEAKRVRRDGNEHHLTVFFKPEFKKVTDKLVTVYAERVKELKQKNGEDKYKGYAGLEKLWLDVLVAEVPCDWKSLGVGSVKQGAEESFFQVIEWPAANDFRTKFGLDKKDFHLSLGFKNVDIHNVDKGPNSLVWRH
jgi:predicted kinase